MKRTILLLVVAVAAACAPRPFDTNAEAKALLARDAEWATVAEAGADVEKTISYWSDDAVVIPPGQPVVEGKAAIRTFVTDTFKIPGFKIRWVSRDVRFSPDGQLAYMRGDSEMTVPGPDGQLDHALRPRRHDLASRCRQRVALRSRHMERPAARWRGEVIDGASRAQPVNTRSSLVSGS